MEVALVTGNKVSEAEAMVIKTGRILLRPHRLEDFDDIHAYSQDPEVVQYMQWGPNSEEQSRQFLANTIAGQSIEQKQNYDFAVELIDNSTMPEARVGQTIGSISLRLPKPDAKLGEIGYCYHKCTWGRGVASEAAEAIMAFGFDKLKLHKISATCDPRNFGSAKVLQKIGMRLEGYLKNHIFMKGIWRDTLMFGTTKEAQAENRKLYRNKQEIFVLGGMQGKKEELTETFGGGIVSRIKLAKGEEIAERTEILDEYYLVMEGAIKCGDKVHQAGTLVHTPLAVKQATMHAEQDSVLLVYRLGPEQ